MKSPKNDIKSQQCEQLRAAEERLDAVAARSDENMQGEDHVV